MKREKKKIGPMQSVIKERKALPVEDLVECPECGVLFGGVCVFAHVVHEEGAG
jgi:hypothetical protein